jgi:leucyl-tRNA synthetase
LDGTTLDDKTLNPKISKMGEMKKAMPFVQGLKRRLQLGESSHTVFERSLAFDEHHTLHEMSAGLKKTTGCKDIDLVIIDEGAGRRQDGTSLDQLPAVADSAVPGNPAFLFENVKG